MTTMHTNEASECELFRLFFGDPVAVEVADQQAWNESHSDFLTSLFGEASKEELN